MDRGPICETVGNCGTAPLGPDGTAKINREASMLVFTRAMKMAAAAVSLAVMLLGAATPSQAQTTGQVRLHIVRWDSSSASAAAAAS